MKREHLEYKDGIPDEEMPELQEEDFARAKPNRFARGIFQLDKDLLSYFKTEKDINEALRLVVQLNTLISRKSMAL
ncbi:hypothetical protein GMMP15_1690009 [Candidatus Magnetomoraceae bacterium gMMP-15]